MQTINFCYKEIYLDDSFRTFWVIFVIASLILSLIISLNEWDKFINNPTALFIETDYRTFFFDKPGLTICPDYTNENVIKDIVLKRDFVLDSEDSNFQYYFDYLNIIANTNYTNLERYKAYINETSIKKEEFIDFAAFIKFNSAKTLKGHLIITELGVCFTSSRIAIIMDPYKGYSFPFKF